ncbi:hypothetical protein ACFO25_16870 [Paenactinomyces guangxiensis]|uniref:Uncharacterized protein n=1 Tax=Paenactinomyces guangxiensis TaxID=1490290 RepID=A0A7W2AA55_9BACL|nr:hypothetical protein [Paenactinomyces guangxiensis]MBA4496430.1 hypothetical protein [Paenactinomyces guangxiensis]MBH8593531.1 hypothetical protein [Paenactinomyces guangxiensis]
MEQKKNLVQRESAMIKKGDAVGAMIYVLAKLGYSRPEIEKVNRELQNAFNLKCSGRVFDMNLTNGRVDRKNLLPTITKQDNHVNNKIDG